MGWFGFLFIRSFLLFGVFFPVVFGNFCSLFCKREATQRALEWTVWEILPFANDNFFPNSSNYWFWGYKTPQLFFYLPFDLGKSYLSIHGNDFSYLSFEFPLTCRAHVAEMMHMKWQCQKQLLTDACCAVITLSISWQPFRICGL